MKIQVSVLEGRYTITSHTEHSGTSSIIVDSDDVPELIHALEFPVVEGEVIDVPDFPVIHQGAEPDHFELSDEPAAPPADLANAKVEGT